MTKRRLHLVVGAVAAALVLPITGALPAATAAQRSAIPAAAGPVPVPEADSFYKVPRDVATYRNGQVIRSRPIQAYGWAIPLPGKAWQVLYRTEDFRGRPSATVTTILVPDQPWPGNGPRPLLSYQTAEDGVAGKCAPSYALHAGAAAGVENSTAEASQMLLALQRGWVVSVPDYEGPRSTFLVAGTEAHGVLDGIRAARNFRPAGVSRRSPIGMWGYSGGSFATVVAAEYQHRYAPELPIRAIALGGLVGSVRASIDAFSGSVYGGTIPMGIHGFLRAYPGLHLLSYLNAKGRQYVAATANDCIAEAVPRHPFLSIEDIEARPHALDSKPVARMLWRNSPLGIKGTPTAPIYHYHATGDELAPLAPAVQLVRRFCRSGVAVQHIRNPIGEHLTEVAVGSMGALRFLGDRFAGKPPISNCGSLLRG